MTLAGIDDLPALEEIENECDRYFDFDPESEDYYDPSLKECLATGHIPPGIDKDNYIRNNYNFYCIWQSDILIGFLTYYLSYRQEDMAYINVLYVKESHRKNGIGAEILEGIYQRLRSLHIREIRLHCSLRNAIALQFWVKNGFDRIINVECNGNLYPENFGGIELAKTIA